LKKPKIRTNKTVKRRVRKNKVRIRKEKKKGKKRKKIVIVVKGQGRIQRGRITLEMGKGIKLN